MAKPATWGIIDGTGLGWAVHPAPPASTTLTPGAGANPGRKVFNMFFYSWLLEGHLRRLVAGGLVFPAFSEEKKCEWIYKGT